MFSRDSTIEYRPLYPETTSYSSTMDAGGQARGGCGGCSGGVPNYRNNILINVVEEYLPQGLEAWRGVTLAYRQESMESTLRRGEDLRDNWNRNLCNRACRSRQVSPVSYPTASTKALQLSITFRMKPMRPFWVRTLWSPATLATMATALSRKL